MAAEAGQFIRIMLQWTQAQIETDYLKQSQAIRLC